MEIKDNSIIIDGYTFKETNYYVFKDNSMFRNVAAGLIKENRRPYRKAGNFNLYIDSFTGAASPYSKYYIADKTSGKVYSAEILHVGDSKRLIKTIVDTLTEYSK